MLRLKPAIPSSWRTHPLAFAPGWKSLFEAISSCVIALMGMLRGLRFLLADRPRTPLRILCIVAFDTLHKLRNKKWIPGRDLQKLAVLLDFGACANATFDRKKWCRTEHQDTLQFLEQAGLGPSVKEYLQRLGILENGRPQPGGDSSRFQKVCLYREDVVRLSLALIAATAFQYQSLDDAIEDIHLNEDLNFLFHIVMHCQIMDDILDFSQDRSNGLPGFLTACQSLPVAVDLTRKAAFGYTTANRMDRCAKRFPLKVALCCVSWCTTGALMLFQWREWAKPIGTPKKGRNGIRFLSKQDPSG